MITTCLFVIWYSAHGLSQKYVQRGETCRQCAELVSAYLEAGPPKWLQDSTVVPMCVRREEEALPA